MKALSIPLLPKSVKEDSEDSKERFVLRYYERPLLQ
jgi:hypothetical protein